MITELTELLNAYAEQWKDIPMLAKTHGQPASPTRLGKEVKVFAYRLEQQIEQLKNKLQSTSIDNTNKNIINDANTSYTK